MFGRRVANELLLTDKWFTAKEALKAGYINGILDGFEMKKDWFNPDLIPVIPKLLATDYKTLVNCMEQINASRDNKKIEEVVRRENQNLLDTWNDPGFGARM